MRRFFDLYQWLGPLILGPLALLGWWRHYDGNGPLVAIAIGVPVLHAYIVPGIGTNVLRMWEFDTRLRLGRFRPHHGFVFGSATALIALPLAGTPDPAPAAGDVAATATLFGAVLLTVNWIYDALALRAGVLHVYNQPHADGAGCWAVAGDYVVWFFGLFGVIHGGGLRLAEAVLLGEPSVTKAALVGGGILLATLTLPTLGYIAASWLRHGHGGLRPIAPAQPDQTSARTPDHNPRPRQ